MKIAKFNSSGARLKYDQGGNVELCLDIPKEFRYIVAHAITRMSEKADKVFTVTIQDEIKDRTLRQNSMCWALCAEIALHDGGGRTGDTAPEDVYYDALSRYGASETMIVQPEALKLLKKTQGLHINVIDRRTADSGTDYYIVKVIQGSSHYDTKQMSNLIDGLLDMAEMRGIDTAETRFIAEQQERERYNGKER